MRRILSIFGSTFIIITANTSVVACDKSQKPILLATKIDISNKISSIINLGQLTSKNVIVLFKI